MFVVLFIHFQQKHNIYNHYMLTLNIKFQANLVNNFLSNVRSKILQNHQNSLDESSAPESGLINEILALSTNHLPQLLEILTSI